MKLRSLFLLAVFAILSITLTLLLNSDRQYSNHIPSSEGLVHLSRVGFQIDGTTGSFQLMGNDAPKGLQGLNLVQEVSAQETPINNELRLRGTQVNRQGSNVIITATFENIGGNALSNIFFRVAVLEDRSGQIPTPSLANRRAGTPANVGAEIDAVLPGNQLQPGQTFNIDFNIFLPRPEVFSFIVDAFTVSSVPTPTQTVTSTPLPPTPTNTLPPTPTDTPVPPTATFTPTPTNTPVPPTATPTNTPLPPTATFTPTATNTPLPPTATFTPTATNTPLPPTATNTPLPPTSTFTPTATNTPILPTPTFTATPIPQADLSITKTDSVDPIVAGNQLVYTVRVDNAGPSDAQNVVVTDTLPAGATLVSTSGCNEDPNGVPTCSLGTISAGGFAEYTITVSVDASVADGTVLDNQASVSSSTVEANPGDESVTESTTVSAQADLSATKTDSADPVLAGNSLAYTIRVDNAGPSDAQGVVVTDTLPAGVTLVSTSGCNEDPNGVPTCTLSTIPSGGFAEYTINVNVDSDVADGTILTNQATVSSNTTEASAGDENASEDTLVNTSADLFLSKSDGRGSANPGDTLIYTVQVNNFGPSDAQNVVVTDTLPAGVTLVSTSGCSEDPNGVPTCTLGTIPDGGQASYSLEVTVDATSGTLTNSASVASSTTEGNPGGETATDDTTVVNNQIAMRLLNTALVGVGRPASVEVILPFAAPPGGTTVTVTSDDSGVLSVDAPGTTFIPAGQTTGIVSVTGVSEASTTLRANAIGYSEGTLDVGVTLKLISLPKTLDVTLGQTESFPVEIAPDPAPAGGVVITLVSDDPNVEVLTPSVTIPQGAVIAQAEVRGASAGTANIIGTNPDYAGDISAVMVSGDLNITDTSITFNAGLPKSMTIQLETAGQTVSAPAPGVPVTLVSNDTTCASVAGTTTIPTGLVSISELVTYGGSASLPCSTTIEASSPGLSSDTVTINVNPPASITMQFLPDEVGAGHYVSPKRAVLGANNHGGIVVRIESSDPSVLLVSPDIATPGSASIDVFVPNLQTVATYVLRGVPGAAIGSSATITGSAPGFNDGTGVGTIYLPPITFARPSITVGSGLQGTNFFFRPVLGEPGHGGVTVRIESENTGIALVSRDQFTAGTPFIDVVMADGATDVGAFFVHGLEGVTGTAVLRASAPGFSDDTADGIVVQPAVALNSLVSNIDTLDPNDAFTARVGLPTSQNNSVTPQAVRVGAAPLTVTLTSSDTGVGRLITPTTSGSPVTVDITEGRSESLPGDLEFEPVNVGTTTIEASIPGFTQTNSAMSDVTVTAPGLVFRQPAMNVASGLQRSAFNNDIFLQATNHGGVTIRIESSDPSLVRVSPDASTPGTAFIDLDVADGGNITSTFFVQGMEGQTGSTTLTATEITGVGFTSTNRNIEVVSPSVDMFSVSSPIDTFDNPDIFNVRIGIPASNNSSLSIPLAARAGGGGVSGTVTSSDPGVGQIIGTTTGSPVAFSIPEGQSSVSLQFEPLTAGHTTLEAIINTPSGFGQTANATQVVDVTQPTVTTPSNKTVGAGLQITDPFQRLSLGALNHGGVTALIESTDTSKVRLSFDEVTPGVASLDFFLPDGQIHTPSFYIQGIEGTTGTVDINVTVPGFTSTSFPVTIVQPGIEIFGLPATIDTLDPVDPFDVRIGVPFSDNRALAVAQEARAGSGGFTVEVSSSLVNVGRLQTNTTVGSPISLLIPEGEFRTPGNFASGGYVFEPLTTGFTDVRAEIPGFITTDDGDLQVEVTTPTLNINTAATTVGAGLQKTGFRVNLSASEHLGVTVRVTSSNDTVALVSPNSSTAGTPFIDVPLANGSTAVFFAVQGVEGASGQVTFTATAPGFVEDTMTVNVVQPVVKILDLVTSKTTSSPDDNFRAVIGIPNVAITDIVEFQNVRAGSGGVTAEFTSSDTGVGELVTLTQSGSPVTVDIAEGASSTPGNVSVGGVAFDSIGAGSTDVSVAIPDFITLALGTLTVNVAP